MQGFEAKKRLLRGYNPTHPFTLYCSVSHNRNPSTNRTRVRWLEAERDNHYTVPLATICIDKMSYSNQMYEKKAIESHA